LATFLPKYGRKWNLSQVFEWYKNNIGTTSGAAATPQSAYEYVAVARSI